MKAILRKSSGINSESILLFTSQKGEKKLGFSSYDEYSNTAVNPKGILRICI